TSNQSIAKLVWLVLAEVSGTIVFGTGKSLRIGSDEKSPARAEDSGELRQRRPVASIQRKMLEHVERDNEVSVTVRDGDCEHACLHHRLSTRAGNDEALQREVQSGGEPFRMRLDKPRHGLAGAAP